MAGQGQKAPESLAAILAPGRLEHAAQRAVRDYLHAAQELPWRLAHVPQKFHRDETARVAGFAAAASATFRNLATVAPDRAERALARMGVRRGQRAPFEPIPGRH